MSFTQPTQDELWVATFGDGIYVVDVKTNRILRNIRKNEINSNSINANELGALYTDDSGLIWVGNWVAGVNRTNSKNSAFRTLSPNHNNPYSISNGEISSL